MQKKSFLFISETYPSGLTGTSVKTRSTIELLLQDGHTVDVACIHFKTLIKKELRHKNLRIFSVYKEGVRKIRLGLIKKAVTLLLSKSPVRVNRMYDEKLEHVVDVLQYSSHYDYILFDGFSTLQYAKAKKENNVYIDDEDITILIKKRMEETNNPIKKIFLFTEYIRCLQFEKIKLQLMGQIWGISPGSLKRLRTVSPAKTALMPTLVDAQPNVFNRDSKDIVFTGTLSWSENYIGLRWFIENCWQTIHTANPKSKLYIIGQQGDSSWEELVNKYENITLMGYVKNLTDIYKQCAIAISPVFINVGIKVKVLTYLSFGLPVVSTFESLGGMPSIQGVLPASKEDFAKKVNRLLESSLLREKIAKRTQKNIAQNHSVVTLRKFFIKTGIY